MSDRLTAWHSERTMSLHSRIRANRFTTATTTTTAAASATITTTVYTEILLYSYNPHPRQRATGITPSDRISLLLSQTATDTLYNCLLGPTAVHCYC